MAKIRIKNAWSQARARRVCAVCSTLFAVAILIGSRSASADVIHTSLEPPGTILPPGTLDIDLDNDASADFVLTLDLMGNLTVEPIGNGVAVVAEGAFGVGTARRYLRCETISGLHNFQSAQLPLNGLWVGATNVYLGLRFSIGSENHLGWAHLDVLPGNSSPMLKGYAYNSVPEGQLSGDLIGPGLTAPPTIICPSDASINCDQSDDPSQTGSATATDACFGPVTVTFEDMMTAGACPHAWFVTRTWTATDEYGLTSTCDQLITVADSDAPTLTVPDDVTVECGHLLEPSELGQAMATDTCDSAPVVTFADTALGTCPTVITRTWTATDACGNVATLPQIITVEDTTAPVIVDCPTSQVLSCDWACLAVLPDFAGEVSATDNCDSELTIEQIPAAGTSLDLGELEVTITVTDDCGNSSECPVSVSVVDDTPPTITCAENLIIDAITGTCAAAAPDLGSPDVGDNCEVDTVENDAPASFSVGTTTVTWTVTDASGNAATCEQWVTVRDIDAPILFCPKDVVIDCGVATAPAGTGGMAIAMDLCDPAPVVTYADSALGGAMIGFARTWTAIDTDGNVATCDQHIFIQDMTLPTITICAEDRTLTADDSGMAILPDLTTEVIASDACGTGVMITQRPPSGTALPLGETPVWLIATNAVGFADMCVATITVVAGEGDDPGTDPIPPEFTPGYPCGPARYLLSRFLMQSLFGVPVCGLGWFTCVPMSCLGMLAMKLRLRRRRQARR